MIDAQSLDEAVRRFPWVVVEARETRRRGIVFRLWPQAIASIIAEYRRIVWKEVPPCP